MGNAIPGFQGSDTSWPEVTIYTHGDDPIVLSPEGGLGSVLSGQKASDAAPSIVSVQTQKSLGSASGSFTVAVKASQTAENLFEYVVDDDWVDIVLYKHDEGWHVMRGLVDEIGRDRVATGNGTTVESFVINGRDFGKIWELTPIWFSPMANDIVTQAVSGRVFDWVPLTSPGGAPISFLRDFLEELSTFDGPNWELPVGIPGTLPISLINNVDFGEDIQGNSKWYQDIPPKTQFNLNALNPNGMVWQLAREYSDAQFTEMYVDMLPGGDPFSDDIANGTSLQPIDMKMTVVLRDKPFPVLQSSVPGWIPTWDDLPVQTVQRQEILSDNVSKSGYERYNAFFAAPRLLQEAMGSYALETQAALVDKESIKRHGLRRMDVQSNVQPGGTTLIDAKLMAEWQRNLLRDWYCLNPYMLSGTFGLGHGRPDLKIGCRMRIPGQVKELTGIEADEQYYIESVGNSWQAGTGMRTTVGVTRGWIGDDADYIAELLLAAARYSLTELKVAIPGT